MSPADAVAAVRQLALDLAANARDLGVIVTIEHVRTPNEAPGTYLIDVREARVGIAPTERKA